MTSSLEKEHSNFQLESDPKYLGFKEVKVTKIDETKPWQPPLEVEVTLANGSKKTIPAETPFFTFVDKDLKKVTVSAADAGHIKSLHIDGSDSGSVFSAHHSIEELMMDIEGKLPEDLATNPNTQAFSVEMNKPMGKEGLASMSELIKDEVITQSDIAKVENVRTEVYKLNKEGGNEEKAAFIESFKNSNPECKVQFKLVRGTVLVPFVYASKRNTTKLFMVFGPDDKGGKTMYTAAPGRNMPRHPNPAQFEENEPKEAFEEAQKAWFDTVMLDEPKQNNTVKKENS